MLKPESLQSFLQAQKNSFAGQGVESPSLSAELLLAATLGITREELLKLLITNPRHTIYPGGIKKFSSLAARRLAGEPVAYIMGKKEFYGRDFKVNPAVLIPRPETELIIDAAKAAFQWRAAGRFADLGTGSGCIAVTLALELGTAWHGQAIDNSPGALETARQNAVALGAADQLDFTLADFKQYVFAPAGLDLLVSNPPYVSEAEYACLDDGVRGFEPKDALVPAGPDVPHWAVGDESLRAVAAQAATALKSGGLLIMEMGWAQGPAMREFFHATGSWREFNIIQDLAGLDRLVTARRP